MTGYGHKETVSVFWINRQLRDLLTIPQAHMHPRFSGVSRLQGAYSYGKTNEKEKFCKEIGCAEAATGAQGPR